MTFVSAKPVLDDSDFGAAEFAKIANECCQRHSLPFAVGTFVHQECFPDLFVFEKLGGEVFATETCAVDDTHHPVDFFGVLVVGETGE